jgi:hypothetical protein
MDLSYGPGSWIGSLDSTLWRKNIVNGDYYSTISYRFIDIGVQAEPVRRFHCA